MGGESLVSGWIVLAWLVDLGKIVCEKISGSFCLEASQSEDKFALTQLCVATALTLLFLVLQDTQVLAFGKRRWVDPHWQQGMSYLKLGWNWMRLANTCQWKIHLFRF